MKTIKLIKKQIITLIVLSVFMSIGAIIHGIFFDLDFSQIKRLTFEGFVITFIVIFPLSIIIEKIFDMNNKEEIDKLNKRIKKLEKKK